MSYCVHCGVKLAQGEARCPLCRTPVYDPAEPRDTSAPRTYPVRTPEQELKRNKGYLLSWAAVLLLLPALLCLMVDALSGGGLSWSVYAAGALLLLFVSIAVPLLLPRNKAYWSILAAFLSLNAYLLMAERVSGSVGWYFPIVLPGLSFGCGVIALLTALYRRDMLNKVTLPAGALLASALECLGIEWLRCAARGQDIRFLWSPYVAAPCIFVSLLLFYINFNRPMREEIRRRVHF